VLAGAQLLTDGPAQRRQIVYDDTADDLEVDVSVAMAATFRKSRTSRHGISG
jgi:hypothetical protein